MSRILIIVTKGEIGGAQTVVASLARGLKEAGFDVVVGCGADTGSFLEEELKKSLIPVVSFKKLTRSHNPFSFIAFIAELRTFLKKNHFDVVHFNSTNTLFGAIAAKLVRPAPKTVFTFHGLSFLDPNHDGNAFVKIAYWIAFKILIWFVDVPVFVSKNNLNYTREIRITARGVVVYNGTSHQFIDGQEARATLEGYAHTPLQDALLIGSIGRLAYPKNYEFFMLAAKDLHQKFPAARFIIIGDGPDRATYEHVIASLDIASIVILAGEIPHAENYLQAFDIFTLTSLYEGAPMTLIEALCAGITTLSPRVGGISEIMADDNTQLFDSQNMAQYEEKMTTLITNTTLRMQKAVWNQERSHKFSTENMVQNYIKIYEK